MADMGEDSWKDTLQFQGFEVPAKGKLEVTIEMEDLEIVHITQARHVGWLPALSPCAPTSFV